MTKSTGIGFFGFFISAFFIEGFSRFLLRGFL